MPVRDRLPDTEQESWPFDNKIGRRVDPWQENHQIVLKRIADEDDGLLTWTTTGYYGPKGMRRFIDAYVKEARKHPGQMPVVALGSKTERSPSYGDIETPLLTIIDWQPFGYGASLPGQPNAMLPTISTLAIEAPSIAADERPDKIIEGKARRDLDDEIPF
jgi:hypothetical protein